MKNKLLMLVIFLICGIGIFPSKNIAQELPRGMVIGDSQGLNATSKGEYHVNITDVLPGGSWHTTISMVNMEKGSPYQLTMLISPATVSGSLDLSKALHMTLTYEGTVVYDGPASGISDSVNLQTTPLDLGVFNAGDSRALEVTYSLSGEYTNKDFITKNVMDNVWTYYAVKTTAPTGPSMNLDEGTTKPSGRLPSMGELMKQAMIMICLGLFLTLIALLIWKKKKERSAEK